MNLLFRLLITASVAFILHKILPGVHIDSFGTAIVFAIVLGLLNLIVKPILKILTFPITLITFGLFSFIITAIITWIADSFIAGFHIDGFLWTLLFSILLSIVSSAAQKMFGVD